MLDIFKPIKNSFIANRKASHIEKPKNTPPPRLYTKSLSLSYGNKPAFRDISLSISSGEILAIVGPSGCGKSSFLTCLNRLNELTPNSHLSGTVHLQDCDPICDRPDCDIQTVAPTRLRRKIGMVFQEPTPFPLSIYQNLAFPLREHGVRHRQERDRLIEAALRDAGLWDEVKDRLNSPAQALSGGQQQRLCLARTLALKPQILLLDEPCSALDPIASETVETAIARLRGQYTIVIVTHNLAQARRISDRLAVFWWVDGAGQLIELGATANLFKQPSHPLTHAYLSGRRG
jgi:phosphate transport system ATP-binding protein